MNMARIRNILEMRRATKAPPLLPPRVKKSVDGGDAKRQNVKEIVDISVKIRNFRSAPTSAKAITCIFSESEDSNLGPWKVSTASDVIEKSVNIDLPNVFAMEFQFERAQYIKLDICDWTDNNAASLGYTVFSLSEVIVSDKSTILHKIINDDTGEVVANVQVSCSIRPKPHSILLQFVAKNIAKKNVMAGSMVFFEVQKQPEMRDAPAPLLYRSEVTKLTPRMVFRSFSIQSTDILEDNVEVMFYYRDAKTTKGYIGCLKTTYLRLKLGPDPEGLSNTYTLTYENSKGQTRQCGTVELLRYNEVILSSFLDYVSTGSTLTFAVAIDFSRPDQFIDESFIRQYLDDVELAVKTVAEPFREFSASSSYAAFGFGAKIPPLYRESQEFCLNFETDPYVRGVDGIMQAFKTSFTKVQPINVAHYSHVIYYVSKMAQNALNRNQTMRPSYFVLVIVTRGVFDDLKEAIQAIIFASRAPISIVFVGIGGNDFTELTRLGTAGTRLNFHGRKPERDCIQFVSLQKCRETESSLSDVKNALVERGLGNIPWQMSTWMSKNGYKPSGGNPVVFSQDIQEEAEVAEPQLCSFRPAKSQAGGMHRASTAPTPHQAFTTEPLHRQPNSKFSQRGQTLAGSGVASSPTTSTPQPSRYRSLPSQPTVESYGTVQQYEIRSVGRPVVIQYATTEVVGSYQVAHIR